MFILLSETIFAQLTPSIGIACNIGTTVNRIGITAGAYYVNHSFQINSKLWLYYNFNSYGPPHSGPEFQASLGLLFGYGKQDTIENKFITSISNQTGKRNSIAITHNYYFDNIKTSQETGTIALEFNHLQIVHENDILGTRASDRYRTAGVLISYRIQNTTFGLNTVLWTGNSSSDSAIRITNSDYPARFGYRDLSKADYGTFSHGILTFQVQKALPYNQIARIDIGADSEHIRNVIQNKIIHDMYFLPKWLIATKLPHYPMLDVNGMPYLYKTNQKVKPSKFFLNFSGNSGVFY